MLAGSLEPIYMLISLRHIDSFLFMFYLVMFRRILHNYILILFREFLNSVWYIKILSPQEVQQMGKEGLNLPNSGIRPNIQSGISCCNDNTSPRDLRNCNNGIASVTSFDCWWPAWNPNRCKLFGDNPLNYCGASHIDWLLLSGVQCLQI